MFYSEGDKQAAAIAATCKTCTEMEAARDFCRDGARRDCKWAYDSSGKKASLFSLIRYHFRKETK